MAQDLHDQTAEDYKLTQMRMTRLKLESESMEVNLDNDDDGALEIPKIKRKNKR